MAKRQRARDIRTFKCVISHDAARSTNATLPSRHMDQTPLVGIVTPVYNCGDYLVECLESVLRQTYSHWELHLIDNASTDNTSEIGQRYACEYPEKVFLHRMDEYLPIVANHNRALAFVSPKAKYAKLLFGDDVLYPRCIEEMVLAASLFPSAGLICSYATNGQEILWQGCRAGVQPCSFYRGTDICRRVLLGHQYIFGTGSSTLIRADLVRARPSLYDSENMHADFEACVDLLQESDLVFVHQILSFSRSRPGSANAEALSQDSHMLGNLTVLLRFGPRLLEPAVYRRRLQNRWNLYYRILAKNVLRWRDTDFWTYHRRRLAQLGYRIDFWKLGVAVMMEFGMKCLHPLNALAGVRRYWIENRP